MAYRVLTVDELIEIGAHRDGHKASFERALTDLENEGFKLVLQVPPWKTGTRENSDPWFVFEELPTQPPIGGPL